MSLFVLAKKLVCIEKSGKCESACPAVPMQEIHLMQFSSQTLEAGYQACSGPVH